MKTLLRAAMLAASVATLLPSAAQAQDADGWKFKAAMYGWFPAIGGSTAFPPHGGGPDIGVSMGDVIDSLKFAFMGSFEATHGKWGVMTDLVYADFGASKTLNRSFTIGGVVPVNVNGQFVLDLKNWIWTLAGTYNLVDSPDNHTDLLFGTRLLDLSSQLSWTLTGNVGGIGIANPGSGSVSDSYWDGLIGLKGRFNFGEGRRWFVNYLADVGTGQSDLTYQGLIGVGYDFDWGSVIASWRYLGYEFKSSSHVQDLNLSGPLVGVVLRF